MLRFIVNLVAGIGVLTWSFAVLIASNFVPDITRNVLAVIGFVPAKDADENRAELQAKFTSENEKLRSELSNENQKTALLKQEFSDWKRERLNGDPVVYSAKAPIVQLTGDQCLEVAGKVLAGLHYKDVYRGHGDQQSHYMQANFTANNAPGKVLFDCFHHGQGWMSPTVSIAYKLGKDDDGRTRVNDIREALRQEMLELGVPVLSMSNAAQP